MLEAAGSSLHDAVKVNIFLTDMDNFSAMNEAYVGFFGEPKPVSWLDLFFCCVDLMGMFRCGLVLLLRRCRLVLRLRLSVLGW